MNDYSKDLKGDKVKEILDSLLIQKIAAENNLEHPPKDPYKGYKEIMLGRSYGLAEAINTIRNIYENID